MYYFTLLCALCAIGVVYGKRLPFNSDDDEFIEHINKIQDSWVAGPSWKPMEEFKLLLGLKQIGNHNLEERTPHDPELIVSLPDTFNAAEKWPNCPTLKEIRDQGNCGSCWAFGAVEAMTDRVCIFSNGSQQFHFSAQDLVSCCDICGDGCGGARELTATWKYWKTDGIVSGGGYGSNEGCMPYQIADKTVDVPCNKTCSKNYPKSYKDDKHYGKSAYSVANNEDEIRAEIFKNGPVEAGFHVYQDFMNYQSGVYHHTDGDDIGGHAVKIVGWGVENGMKYWLIANSWGTSWATLGGFFKMLRGTNECGIEEMVVAGEPLIK